MGGRYVPSLLAAIGEVIENHMVQTGFLERGETALRGPKQGNSNRKGGDRKVSGQCPRCGGASLIHQEGCDTCSSCGWSRCG